MAGSRGSGFNYCGMFGVNYSGSQHPRKGYMPNISKAITLM